MAGQVGAFHQALRLLLVGAGEEGAQLRPCCHAERDLAEPNNGRSAGGDGHRRHRGDGRRPHRSSRSNGRLDVGVGGLICPLGDERQDPEDEHNDDRPRQEPLVATLVESQADAVCHGGKLCRQAVLVTAP